MRMFKGLLSLTLVGALLVYLIASLPPRHVVIEAGPIGGTYYEHAEGYAALLEQEGFQVEILSNPDSADTINRIDNPDLDIDIGFAAQPVVPEATPRVRTLAKVELQPLFMFYSIALGEVVSLVNLRDRRIVMPAPSSATSVAALEILALYGVTPENTTIEHMDIVEGAERLKAGEFDAGFFMLASENAIIRDLATDTDLAAYSYNDARPISINLDYLTATTLPAGGFDLARAIPPARLDLVGAEVHVITHEDLHPAVAYAMMDAVEQWHGVATAVSDLGTYPSYVGARLPLLDEARDFSQSGRPWTYRLFGTYWGSLLDELTFLILGLFLFTQGYRTIKYFLELLEYTGIYLTSSLVGYHLRRKEAGKEEGLFARASLALAQKIALRRTVKEQARSKLKQYEELSEQAPPQRSDP